MVLGLWPQVVLADQVECEWKAINFMMLEYEGRQRFYIVGLLKKAASGVLAIFPCSRTKRTLRA